jgi:ketosteroid isomerase-like protein
MKSTAFALSSMVLAAGMAVASDSVDVMGTVQQFVDGFNQGDMAAVAGACSDRASVIDDFPPHELQGAGACKTWMEDYNAYAKKNGISNGNVTLREPKHVEVTADRAYVVVPANFAYTKDGKPTDENGSTLVLALQKIRGAWYITAWAWGAR